MANNNFAELTKRLDDEFRANIFQSLPNLAVQIDELWAKYYSISQLDKKNVGKWVQKLPKPDEHLLNIHAQTYSICREAAEKVHLIESRILRLTSDVRLSGEVLVGEILDRSLKLSEGLRHDLEDLLIQLNHFHSNRAFHIRKILKHPAQGQDALEEFEQKSLCMTRIQLAKIRNLMIILYEILSENFEILNRKEAKNTIRNVYN